MDDGAGSDAKPLSPPAPLIVTATLGAADFAWANGLRRAHFPAERNFVPAHITLFHHLPPSALRELQRRCAALARDHAPPAARLSAVMSLGRGVAFRVESPALLAVRAALADAFAGVLVPQDRSLPRLHITVQNKVAPQEAKALHALLSAGFRPRPLAIEGLALWHYRGGPWEAIATHRFRGRAEAG